MTENYVCYAKAEDELNAIRGVEDWHISNLAPLRFSLQALGKALDTLVAHKDVWKGETADAARTRMTELAARLTVIDQAVGDIVTAVDAANTARRTASGGELPSAQVDPFWANAVKAGATVVHPALGPLAADKALEVIGDWMSGQREEKAREKVDAVRVALAQPTSDIAAARAKLNGTERTPVEPGGPGGDGGSTPGGGTGGPGGYGGPGAGGGGGYTGGGYPGGPSGGYTGGGSPGGPGGGALLIPENPGPDYPGPGDPGYPGGPTIDDPHPSGHIPGSGGSGSGGAGHAPGGGGSIHGGLAAGLAGGGGAAALAFGARGSFGGAGAGLAGLKSGGLLGGTAGGTGGLLGAGGPGASGSGAAGATGMGARSGGGMIGGEGQGASEEEKQRRAGSIGPIAPHLEDDEEPIPLPKSGRAGSRGDSSQK